MRNGMPAHSVVVVGDGAAELCRKIGALPGKSLGAKAILQGHAVADAADIDAMAAADAIVVAGPLDKMERSSLRRALVVAHATGLRACFLYGLPGQAIAAMRIFAIGVGFEVAASVVSDAAIGQAVQEIKGARAQAIDTPLRVSVDKVYGRRTVSGRLHSGLPAMGDEIVLLPEPRLAKVAECASADAAIRGGTIELTLDRDVALQPGDVLSHAAHRPEVADQVAAQIVWLSSKPLIAGRTFDVSLLGQRSGAHVSTLKHAVDHETLSQVAARMLSEGQVGACNIAFDRPLAFDAAETNRAGAHVVIHDRETGEVAGHAFISFALRRATNIHWQALAVDKAARATLRGQKPCCLWFTGLSGSGKSTVASLLEKRLHAMGRHTYTLDGDNVRHGLNRDLGFTDTDRVENIRRVAEVAKLFVDAGEIVMVSFISPFRAERRMARELLPDGEFIEIFVDTPLDVCEQRDPKGLYKKARAGQLKNFTGIDSAYETPEHAEIVLDGGGKPAEELVEDVLAELRARGTI